MYQQPPHVYPPPKKKFPWWGYIAAVVGFLFVLGAISTLASGRATPQPTPTAASVARVTVPSTRGPTPTSIYAGDPTVQAAVRPPTAVTTKAITMTPEDIVKNQLADSHRGTFEAVQMRDLGQGKILAIDYTGIGNNKSFINQAMLEFKESTPLYFAQLPDIAGLDVKVYADFVDTSGQSSHQVAVRLGVSRTSSAKINWPNTLVANMETLADSVYIHPSIMKYWIELKSGK